MATYKNIRIKKRGGGTRTQRVQVLASGKYKFVKNKGGASKSKTTKRKNKTKKRRNYMARRKKRKRKSRSFTIPLALTVGALSGIISRRGGQKMSALEFMLDGKFEAAFRELKAGYLGITPRGFNIKNLEHGFLPLMIGMLVHKVASKLGVNRKLGQAGVPIIRI